MSEQDDEVRGEFGPDYDLNPKIDTMHQCYWRERDHLIEEMRAQTFDGYSKDFITPSGVWNDVWDTFYSYYEPTEDIAVLIKILETYPVYGNPDMSIQIIEVLKKSRRKPQTEMDLNSNKKFRKRLHVIKHFDEKSPKRGEVDAAYVEIAEELNLTPSGVKTIINRERRSQGRRYYSEMIASKSIDELSPKMRSLFEEMIFSFLGSEEKSKTESVDQKLWLENYEMAREGLVLILKDRGCLTMHNDHFRVHLSYRGDEEDGIVIEPLDKVSSDDSD